MRRPYAWLLLLLIAGCAQATPTASGAPSEPPPGEATSAVPASATSPATITHDEFATHLQTATTALDTQLTAIEEAKDYAFPGDAVQWASLGLLQWSADEGAWIDQGLPDDCYREAWARYGDAIAFYEGAAEVLEEHAIHHYEMALSQGTTFSDRADAALVEAGVLMGSAAC